MRAGPLKPRLKRVRAMQPIGGPYNGGTYMCLALHAHVDLGKTLSRILARKSDVGFHCEKESTLGTLPI